MLRVVEPLISAREAPPVAGVRRELMLVVGGKAPRLDGVRVEPVGDGHSAPPIYAISPVGAEPTNDAAPPISGVVRAKDDTSRPNFAVVAAGASVLAHVLILAWALHSIQPDEALAKGGDMSPIVIEGIAVELVDQVPSPLSEAQAVEETKVAAEIAEDSAAKATEDAAPVAPQTEVAALTPAEVVAPVEETVAPTPEPAVATAVADATSAPVEVAAPVAAAVESLADAASPVASEARSALADDAPASPAVLDPTSNVTPTKSEDVAMAAPAADVVAAQPVESDATAASAAAVDVAVKPVEPEAAQAVEEPEVLAKDIPDNSAPATDLYRDTIATDDDVTEHAPVADDVAKPVDPPKIEVATVADTEKIAPLEEKADPVDAPQDKQAPPKPKKVAAAKATPSKPRQESVAEKAAQAPLFGTAGAGGASDAERGRANVSSYRAQASAHLRRYRSYPDGAHDLTGTAWVSFTVNTSGQVLSAQLSRSSGHAVLDRAALGMVKRASPFPPLPADYTQKSLAISAPVRFER